MNGQETCGVVIRFDIRRRNENLMCVVTVGSYGGHESVISCLSYGRSV